MERPARIAIVGVGAIGGLCGARLCTAGHEVALCVRRRFDALVVETPNRRLRTAAEVTDRPADVGVADWVLVATKAHQLDGASDWLEAAVGPDTRVAVLQNGVEHVERMTPWVPPERVVPVVVDAPAERLAPGHVRQRREAELRVSDDPSGRAFAALFAGTDVSVRCVKDWPRAAWEKLTWNAAGGAVAALVGRGLPEIEPERRRAWGMALAHEVVETARAEGVALAVALAADVARQLAELRSGGTPSTLADRLAARPLEVDARNGAVVRIARRHGLVVPANEVVAERMHRCHLGDLDDRLPENPPSSAAG